LARYVNFKNGSEIEMKAKLQIAGPPPVYDELLRQWLADYLKAHPHLTTAVLSRSDHIGISRTALDGYLDGSYFQSKEAGGKGVANSRIENLIRAYRDRMEGTTRHGYTQEFIKTRSWMQFQHAVTTAINESAIVVVYGKPGVGKSRCLQQFAIEKMSTSPISVLCSANVTTRYFVQKIARALELDESVTTARLEDLCADKLRRTPRPIFVDQANYLNEKGLGAICYLWERARVPIVLIGTHDLYDLFTSSRMTEDVRAQLSSRIAMNYALVELGDAEIKSIVERALGKDASAEVIAQIINATGRIHRHVDMILPRINEFRRRNEDHLAAGTITMSSLVEAAGSRLMLG
jgi:DNA transposition AAA+ family ATPase